nr:RecName: Full=Alpha-amylase inhibitor DR2 [Delonix regia]
SGGEMSNMGHSMEE